MSQNFFKNQGTSIIEIVIAIAIFAIISSSFALILIHSFSGIMRAEEYLKAQSMIDEAESAIISIKKRAFNEIIYNESSISNDSGKWELLGEGKNFSEDGFLREIYFLNIFRDSAGVYVASTSDDAFNDPLSKKVLIDLSWQDNNKDLSLEKEFLISSWESSYWRQVDFSQGDGINIWSEDGFYLEDDANIDNSISGSLKLKKISTSTYASFGYLISSAFFVEDVHAFNAIFWEENISDNCFNCEIRVQIKTALDNSGVPGEWSNTWSGPNGEDGNESDYFSENRGELINFNHNGDKWIKYKVMLLGDSSSTPELNNISIFYQ